MSEPTSKLDPWHETLTRGHEPDHVSRRAIVISVVCLIAFAVAMHAGLWFLLKAQLHRTRDTDTPTSIISGAEFPMNAPPVQPSQAHNREPQEDLRVMYREEDRVFGAMGWTVNPQTHEARLPDALLQRVAADAARRRSSTPRPATMPTTRRSAVVTPVPGVDQGARP